MDHSRGRLCHIWMGALHALGAHMKRIIIPVIVILVIILLLWLGLWLIPPDKTPVTSAEREVAATTASTTSVAGTLPSPAATEPAGLRYVSVDLSKVGNTTISAILAQTEGLPIGKVK